MVDSLHCLYLGVMKKILSLWFGKESAEKEYSVRSKVIFHLINNIASSGTFLWFLQIDLCDRRLLNIKVPEVISRTPRSLEDFKRWKGKLPMLHEAPELDNLTYTKVH